ncbi:hypothetical protein MMIC_P1716 [Mariprofundus micogutta]|uniref:Uncharacterized protein n=1 Tax=Mariprofundus micogutta TaxID=1921010 RepID=A0A1L8CPD7_9PROT|nr:hypothetical protein [Mariprofundus micogutta]GAV20743.1 hypothetical protein MMIC_P1716 [Mariprofundus micogutta]
MLEYVFFDPRPRDLFISQVHELGVEISLKQKGEELLVLLPDDLTDDINNQVENFFMATLDMSEELMAEAEGVESFNVTGVEVKLKNGESVMASVDAMILGKVLSVLDFDELAQFVDAITQAVEEPDYRPICKRD